MFHQPDWPWFISYFYKLISTSCKDIVRLETKPSDLLPNILIQFDLQKEFHLEDSLKLAIFIYTQGNEPYFTILFKQLMSYFKLKQLCTEKY